MTAESSYISYIEGLPLVDEVEVFGLHENASFTFQTKEALGFAESLQAIEPAALTSSIQASQQASRM